MSNEKIIEITNEEINEEINVKTTETPKYQKAGDILKNKCITIKTLKYFSKYFYTMSEADEKNLSKMNDLNIHLDQRHNENDVVMILFQIIIGYQFFFSDKFNYDDDIVSRSTIRDPLPITNESLNLINFIVDKRIFSELYEDFKYDDMKYIINVANKKVFLMAFLKLKKNI